MSHLAPYPDLPLDAWRPSRDAIAGYSKVLGAVRRATVPRQRHWAHVSLAPTIVGLSTGPMPTPVGPVCLELDLAHITLVAETGDGRSWVHPLRGESPGQVAAQLIEGLDTLTSWRPALDSGSFDTTPTELDGAAVRQYARALSSIAFDLTHFKGAQREETSPVQLFPHHFDLALSWFSGRLVPGEDSADEDRSDEQMTFGFSTGDDGVREPYLYATAYPEPDGFLGSELPAEARWIEDAFRGAVLPYSAVVGNDDGSKLVARFLEATHRAGRHAMGV